ncbi:Arm DNA-binding domain-containing protein, partial [Thiolapillus sp.]|uniref:Arm DNA-binding domain-containing protein n=1 Tax=Thiolapillus sp. TaxID=2017437 RepID=UPI003AF6CD2C
MSNPSDKPRPIRTELQLARLRPGAKRVDVPVSIAPGLYVRIFPSGRKTFRWDRGSGHKPRIITYGSFPDMSLAAAIDTHRKNKKKHREGIAVDVHAANANTVAELAELFYSRRIVPHRKRPDVVRDVLDRDILPSIGRAKVTAITPAII